MTFPWAVSYFDDLQFMNLLTQAILADRMYGGITSTEIEQSEESLNHTHATQSWK